jgi:predicted ribosome-associated RNA-binding protein Tma20
MPPLPARPRSPDHVQLLVLDKTPLFFSMRDGPWFPTLRLLHQVWRSCCARCAHARLRTLEPAGCPPASGPCLAASGRSADVEWQAELSLTKAFFPHGTLQPSPPVPPLYRLQYPDMMPRLRADLGAIKFVLSGANIMCPGLTSPGATMHDEVGGRGQRPGVERGPAMRQGATWVDKMTRKRSGFVNRGGGDAVDVAAAEVPACCITEPPKQRPVTAWRVNSPWQYNPTRPTTPISSLQVDEGAAAAIYAEGKEHAMAVGYTKMSTEQVGGTCWWGDAALLRYKHIWKVQAGRPAGKPSPVSCQPGSRPALRTLPPTEPAAAAPTAARSPSVPPRRTKFTCAAPPLQMRELNKGIAVDNLHYLTDGLWKTPALD